MTDISPVKFAEIVQNSRVEEAVEARRQQENFIDMTSHEVSGCMVSSRLILLTTCYARSATRWVQLYTAQIQSQMLYTR